MGRRYFINGETLVKVKGNTASGIAQLSELGLTEKQVIINPRWRHHDIHPDDFGPESPPEVMYQLADVIIVMTLVHYDTEVLWSCVAESMANTPNQGQGQIAGAGTLAGCGTLMGSNHALLSPGNHFISLNLLSPVGQEPWHFPATYLYDQPIVVPLGTARSLVSLRWRAVPYTLPVTQLGKTKGEVLSAGAILWNGTLDT